MGDASGVVDGCRLAGRRDRGEGARRPERGRVAVPTLEEIVFEAGRDALADQDSVVTGIRQRTGTLLAAHALVASFPGSSWSCRPSSGLWLSAKISLDGTSSRST